MHPYLFNEKFSFASQRPTPGFRDRSIATLGILRRWFQASLRRWQRRRMIAAFEALDDRLLQDIGNCRGEIPRIVDSFDDRELRMTPVSTKASQAERPHGNSAWQGGISPTQQQHRRNAGGATTQIALKPVHPGRSKDMMISKADFEELFPELFQPEHGIDAHSHERAPSAECLARWEDDGGRFDPAGPPPGAVFDRSRDHEHAASGTVAGIANGPINPAAAYIAALQMFAPDWWFTGDYTAHGAAGSRYPVGARGRAESIPQAPHGGQTAPPV